MGASYGEEVKRTMAAIESYLSQHPLASDTADGIARWWCTEQGFSPSKDATVAALQALERDGRVNRRCISKGTETWSRAQPEQTAQ